MYFHSFLVCLSHECVSECSPYSSRNMTYTDECRLDIPQITLTSMTKSLGKDVEPSVPWLLTYTHAHAFLAVIG